MSWNQTPCTTLCDIGEVPCVLMEHKICDVGGEVHAFGPLEWKLNCDSFASIFLIWYVNEQVRDQWPSSMDNLPRLNSGASEWGGLPQFTLSTAYSSDLDIKPSLIIMWPICRCDSSKQIMQGSPIISWRWLKFLPKWRLSPTLDLKSFVVDWNNCDEDSVLLKRLLVSHFME